MFHFLKYVWILYRQKWSAKTQPFPIIKDVQNTASEKQDKLIRKLYVSVRKIEKIKYRISDMQM